MHTGLTRLSAVVSAGLVLMTAGAILPKVQAARADAARLQCQENLRKLGRGLAAFESAKGGFPPMRHYRNAAEGGWGPYLLPHLGEEELSKKYDMRFDFYDPTNKPVTETKLKVFLCPAAPADDRFVTIQAQASAKSENANKDTVFTVKASANDYIASNGVLMPATGYWMTGDNGRGIAAGSVPMSISEIAPVSRITDGMSTTLLLIEQAGRPTIWRNGKKKDGLGQFGVSVNARGSWAGWGSIAFGPSDAATGENRGNGDATDCTVNCNNWFGIYGFHAEGANVLMCDGSVRFVTPRLNPLTFAYMTMCDDGNLIFQNDF